MDDLLKTISGAVQGQAGAAGTPGAGSAAGIGGLGDVLGGLLGGGGLSNILGAGAGGLSASGMGGGAGSITSGGLGGLIGSLLPAILGLLGARAVNGQTGLHQLVDSKRWLEQLLGHPVLDFAYPSGQFNAHVVAEVRLAGYSTAVTTLTSVDHSMADRYTWARVRVGGGESMSDFVMNLGTPMASTTITTVDVELPEQAMPPLVRPGLEFK